jgi:hypothetical protein
MFIGYNFGGKQLYRGHFNLTSKSLETDTRLSYTSFDEAISYIQVNNFGEETIVSVITKSSSEMTFLIIKLERSVIIVKREIGFLTLNRRDLRFNCMQEEFDGVEQRLVCAMVSTNIHSLVLGISIKLLSMETVVDIRFIKQIDTMQGFRCDRVLTMGNYSAVLYQNLKSSDEDFKPISELASAGLGSLQIEGDGDQKFRLHSLSKDSSNEQTDFKIKPLISEESIVAVYRLNDSSTAPFVILSSAMIEKGDNSKLMSIYFDLDLEGNETHLIINARFEKQSLIKKYKLQNMSLEVTDAGRVHMKKTKIVLTGIDSTKEIELSQIFKTNVWRICLTWLLFLTIMLGIYVGGACFIIRQFNEEHPNRYYTSPRRTFVKPAGDTQRDIDTKAEDLTLTA